ncbi:MAG: hypothetical protein MSA09_10620 [Lachnospiraceae bacterium]|nr:hypothetical protein [Lachnospiraceae bacterium]
MNKKEKFAAGVKASFRATFHKGHVLGKMGYLHDELEVVGNDISYMHFKNTDIGICRTKNEFCQRGMGAFINKKYKDAYREFEKINLDQFPEGYYVIAICNLYGKGVKKNIAEGIRMAKMGADRSLCCKQLLARCYIEGKGVQINKRKAYELIIDTMSQMNSRTNTDIDDDYFMPDIIHFCGEYELENGQDEKALEHLQMAAVDKNYGQSYYLLGKYYFEDEPEKAKKYLNRAKQLNVNVSSAYYADERAEVSDETIDGGVFEKLSKGTSELSSISESLDNIMDHVDKLDPTNIKLEHLKKVNEYNAIKRQEELEKLKHEQKTLGYEAINAVEKFTHIKQIRKSEGKSDKEETKLEKQRRKNRERKDREKLAEKSKKE